MDYYVYLLAKGYHSTLYTGVTNNLERRVSEHKQKLADGHTKKYAIDKLVYYEAFPNINDAIHCEKQLKRYPREYKYNLIEHENLYWTDISLGWYAANITTDLVEPQTPGQARGDNYG